MINCHQKKQVVTETIRKMFSGESIAIVALEAIHVIKTVNPIAQDFGVHPTQVNLWKRELQGQASNLFDAKRVPKHPVRIDFTRRLGACRLS